MASIIHHKPRTPGQRFFVRVKESVSKKRPEAALTEPGRCARGRNCYGRITSRRRGSGHKRLYRRIDFKRDKLDIPATVQAIEYDPNRTASLALLAYRDGEKRYILCPHGLKEGDTVLSTDKPVEEYAVGFSLPLALIPPAIPIHSLEMQPGKGAQIARGAGNAAQIVSVEGKQVTIKMPSGEIRYLSSRCRATIGTVGNVPHRHLSIGKAGRNRWMGRRPRVRGVAMNPHDHPMGGGEGRTSGGGHPQSPWGQLSKGFPTRTKSKPSNSLILLRRNKKKFKKK